MNRDKLIAYLGPQMRPGWHNDPRILVDPEDAWLLDWKWGIITQGGKSYIQRSVVHGKMHSTIRLAHCILPPPPGQRLIYKNHNALDVRRANLHLRRDFQHEDRQALQGGVVVPDESRSIEYLARQEWLTTAQVAELLQIHMETVRRWIRDGDLPVLDIGGPKAGYRIRRTDLDAFIESRYGPIKKAQP